jgi:glycerol-3-phosphate dehydrogenase
MERNLKELAETHFDVLVIGGGIYGAWVAQDAALRGFQVALVEKEDFGHATSFNSLKIIHGGLRYLQHLDIKRMRESIAERSVLLRIAPHLIHPLPFLMPTYGYGLQSQKVMQVALTLNDLIGVDRNLGVVRSQRLKKGYTISKDECLKHVPGLPEQGLTGGAVWHDGQLSSSERLIVAVLRGATQAGATIANYVKVTGVHRQGNRITGVHVFDQISGDSFDIHCRMVVNAAGPWAPDIHKWHHQSSRPFHLSKAMNLVVRRPLVSQYAVGVSTRHAFHDPQAKFHKGHRLFFMVPARHYTLIGTTHTSYDDQVDQFNIDEQEVEEFIHDMNRAYPPANLGKTDIAFVYAGLLPMNAMKKKGREVSLLKQSQILDLEREAGIQGFLTIVGVKLTEARAVAEKTIDLICQKFGNRFSSCQTACRPIDGGELGDPEQFIQREIQCTHREVSSPVLRHLIQRYGSSYSRVLENAVPGMDMDVPLSRYTQVTHAEILHAVREEMAVKLEDVVRRRTELGIFENPGDSTLALCAEIMAGELGWSEYQRQQELDAVRRSYSQGIFTFYQDIQPTVNDEIAVRY